MISILRNLQVRTRRLRFVGMGPALWLLASSCGGMDAGMHGNLPPPETMVAPPPAAGDLALPVLEDESPDPSVVEVRVVAMPADVAYLPGTRTQAWTYNGRVPGPVLRASVGNRVIVHFTNNLPEPTTIHWHGVRVANAMDGVEAVMTPVAPGGSFTYDFTVPDAGTFWFHPHFRSEEQVEKGLYAPIVVRPAFEPPLPVVADEVLVLDDVLIDVATGTPLAARNTHMDMMGREGNLALVNGRAANVIVSVKAGEWRRWRIINAATARYFRLALAGGQMVRIGGDAGLLEAPEPVSDLLLVPGERAEVLVSVDGSGATAVLRAIPYERALGAGQSPNIDLVRLSAVPAPQAGGAPPLPTGLRPPLPDAGTQAIVRQIRLGQSIGHGGIRFTINGATYPSVPPIAAAVGTVEAWDVVNENDMDHPFHLHGFFFRTPGGRELKDSLNIPARRTVRLLVDFGPRDGAAGTWMYHCHILAHAERGMMAEVRVAIPAR